MQPHKQLTKPPNLPPICMQPPCTRTAAYRWGWWRSRWHGPRAPPLPQRRRSAAGPLTWRAVPAAVPTSARCATRMTTAGLAPCAAAATTSAPPPA